MYLILPYRIHRACYHLEQHSRRTGTSMQASLRLATPITINRIVAVPNKKLLGPRFKMDQKEVLSALEGLEGEGLEAFKRDIEEKGKHVYTMYMCMCICSNSLYLLLTSYLHIILTHINTILHLYLIYTCVLTYLLYTLLYTTYAHYIGEASVCEGKYIITKDLVTFESETKTVHETKYTPSVIEPSYGIGKG